MLLLVQVLTPPSSLQRARERQGVSEGTTQMQARTQSCCCKAPRHARRRAAPQAHMFISRLSPCAPLVDSCPTAMKVRVRTVLGGVAALCVPSE